MLQSKPDVPNFNPVNVQGAQAKAIAANKTALPELEEIGNNINQFNTDQIQKMLKQVIPGYEGITSGISSKLQELISGKIPDDVSKQLQLSDASRAIGGGYSGTGMHRNLVARDLGLTSLDLTSKGLSSAESWLKTMDSISNPGQFNFSSLFVTPQMEINTEMWNTEGQMQRDWLSNQNDAAHSFGTILGTSLINTDKQLTQMASSLLGGFMGGGKM